MVDVEFVGQLVDSMEDAVLRLERAIEKGDREEENKMRVFIFDLHKQIGVLLEAKEEGCELARLVHSKVEGLKSEVKKKKDRKKRKKVGKRIRKRRGRKRSKKNA